MNIGLYTYALPIIRHTYARHTYTAIMTTSKGHPMLLFFGKTKSDLVQDMTEDHALSSPMM